MEMAPSAPARSPAAASSSSPTTAASPSGRGSAPYLCARQASKLIEASSLTSRLSLRAAHSPRSAASLSAALRSGTTTFSTRRHGVISARSRSSRLVRSSASTSLWCRRFMPGWSSSAMVMLLRLRARGTRGHVAGSSSRQPAPRGGCCTSPDARTRWCSICSSSLSADRECRRRGGLRGSHFERTCRLWGGRNSKQQAAGSSCGCGPPRLCALRCSSWAGVCVAVCWCHAAHAWGAWRHCGRARSCSICLLQMMSRMRWRPGPCLLACPPGASPPQSCDGRSGVMCAASCVRVCVALALLGPGSSTASGHRAAGSTCTWAAALN